MAKTKNKKTSKRKNAKSKKKQKPQKSLMGFLLKWTFVLGVWTTLILGSLFAWYGGGLPDITKDFTFERQSSITIKAADGSTLIRYGETKGESITVSDLPSHLIYAVLATEDRRFYSHFGIDPIGIARAMITNIQSGRLVQGGSTITQQLAKNLFLSHERTLARKIQEAMLALWLEQQLSKDDILSAYLNRVYLGSGAYGVDAASRLYFDKAATQVNLREAAMLAGLLKAPSRFSPLRNPGLAAQRSDVVLRAMVDAGYLDSAAATTMTALPPKPTAKPNTVRSARYFTDWVLDGLDELIGTPQTDLIVETTLVPAIQKTGEESLHSILIQNGSDRNVGQGAIITMRDDGAILAMVGGKDYKQSQFNRATQAIRQPGSAFKPVLYLTALDFGWSKDDVLLDEPLEIDEYAPKNFNEKYHGEITLEESLALSANTASVRLLQEIGVTPVKRTAKKLGVISSLSHDLSLALGSSGVSPLELSIAYAAFANGGYSVFPYAITRITDTNGVIFYERENHDPKNRVADKKAIEGLDDMLQTVVQSGTGRAANIPGHAAAGKTGTSQNSRDAWFAGYADDIIAVTWLGNDDNAPMNGVTGGGFPAQIWASVMKTALNEDRSNFYQGQGRNAFDRLLLSLGLGSSGDINSSASGSEQTDREAEQSKRFND